MRRAILPECGWLLRHDARHSLPTPEVILERDHCSHMQHHCDVRRADGSLFRKCVRRTPLLKITLLSTSGKAKLVSDCASPGHELLYDSNSLLL